MRGVSVFAFAAACGSSAAPPAAPEASGASGRPVAEAAPNDAGSVSPVPDAGVPAPDAGVSAPDATPPGVATPARSFPPADVKPRHARSAAEGDGRWTVLSPDSPALATTVLHPHEASRFITVTVVAVDLARVSIGFMPGTEDLGGRNVPFAAGLVPEGERERLVAVFNGGFQPRHGRWGMKLADTTVVPPRDPGCTVALYANGAVRLRSWPALAATAAEMRAFRQTPPCLLEEGAVHPDLLAGRDKAWAGQTPGIVTRRRSALGLDEGGELLFYAIGVEASPRLLAEALRAVGAHHGAELDINWNWTRFLLFGKDADGRLRVSKSLVEGEVSKSGYVERPSERDFFYVLRR